MTRRYCYKLWPSRQRVNEVINSFNVCWAVAANELPLPQILHEDLMIKLFARKRWRYSASMKLRKLKKRILRRVEFWLRRRHDRRELRIEALEVPHVVAPLTNTHYGWPLRGWFCSNDSKIYYFTAIRANCRYPFTDSIFRCTNYVVFSQKGPFESCKSRFRPRIWEPIFVATFK